MGCPATKRLAVQILPHFSLCIVVVLDTLPTLLCTNVTKCLVADWQPLYFPSVHTRAAVATLVAHHHQSE